MSYGASLNALLRRAAFFVDRLLKGARPAHLPVEQPTKFELVVNRKTARVLGVRLPQSLLLQADANRLMAGLRRAHYGRRHPTFPMNDTPARRRPTSSSSGPGARDARPPAAEHGVMPTTAE